MRTHLCFLICFLCVACENASAVSDEWITISGREKNLDPLYRIRTPKTWKIVKTQDNHLEDTTKSLVEFFIEDTLGTIRITIHNFPSHFMEDRIPPLAQIARWKRQYKSLDPTHQFIFPQSFSGFQGYCYEGVGICNQQKVLTLAWGMQIAEIHYQTLYYSDFPIEARADVTIKAQGPVDAMIAHKEEIQRFATSFELIREIPSKS